MSNSLRNEILSPQHVPNLAHSSLLTSEQPEGNSRLRLELSTPHPSSYYPCFLSFSSILPFSFLGMAHILPVLSLSKVLLSLDLLPKKYYQMCFSTLELWGIQIRRVPSQSPSLLVFSFILVMPIFNLKLSITTSCGSPSLLPISHLQNLGPAVNNAWREELEETIYLITFT